MLLLHGLGSRRQVWGSVLDKLAERYEVYALDTPGFGESPIGTGSSIPKVLDAIEQFMDEHGIAAAHFVGNSMGGALSLELAGRGRALSVTAFSPIGFWSTPGRIWCQVGLTGGREVASHLGSALPRVVSSRTARRLLVGIVLGRPNKADSDTLMADVHALVDSRGFEEARGSFTDYEFRDASGLVGTPVTIAWGKRDVLLTYWTQAARARVRLPQAHHVSLSGCGHTPFYDDPALCTATILETTARAGAGRAAEG